MVKYVKGDLFDTDCDIIAYGVNCRDHFTIGIAALVSKYYPRAKSAYYEKYEQESWFLGDVQFVLQNDGKYVANCATQSNYGYSGDHNADYLVVRKCMEKVKIFAQYKNLSIAIPKIGCGGGGGDWDTVKNILEEVFADYNATIYYL